MLSTGSLPRNSGMRPYEARSAVVRPLSGVGDVSAVVSGVIGGRGNGAPKPIDCRISTRILHLETLNLHPCLTAD